MKTNIKRLNQINKKPVAITLLFLGLLSLSSFKDGKPGEKKSTIDVKRTSTDTGPKSRITVKLDGRSFDFDLALNSDMPILDAALKQGADLPFACKGGVCGTCRAKVTCGDVEMRRNYALEDYEVDAGFVLTCQTFPVGEQITVDFDA